LDDKIANSTLVDHSVDDFFVEKLVYKELFSLFYFNRLLLFATSVSLTQLDASSNT